MSNPTPNEATPAPDELFSASDVASESPRLKWLRAHGLRLWQSPADIVGATSPETGDEIAEWNCGRFPDDTPPKEHHGFAGGDTADEACAAYATAHKIPLWNESP